mmetsp:Transcript_63896/g.109702  ORF Transcript_63896/g.109702 Transcript_63896/m.109702 type:complete len:88 (-) Transcript_63896:567-830(-)
MAGFSDERDAPTAQQHRRDKERERGNSWCAGEGGGGKGLRGEPRGQCVAMKKQPGKKLILHATAHRHHHPHPRAPPQPAGATTAARR